MAELTRVIALDCKMVGVPPCDDDVIWVWALAADSLDSSDDSEWDMVAKVSLVNEHLECIMDTYVKPTKIVINYRTRETGVKKEDLENGEDFKEVQKKVKEILEGRILVGHRVSQSIEALGLTHPDRDIRDTYVYFCPCIKFGPDVLSLFEEYRGKGPSIPGGVPSSLERARTVMKIYHKLAAEWEEDSDDE